MMSSVNARHQQRGGWNRLKPVSVDYLDSIGLPSKGDTRCFLG